MAQPSWHINKPSCFLKFVFLCSGELCPSWNIFLITVLLDIDIASQLIAVVVFQTLSRVWLFATTGSAAYQVSLSFTISPSLLKLVSNWINDAIQPSHPLSSPSPHAFNLSQHQGFSPMSQLFTSGGQSIGASTSTSIPPMNIQGWFPLGLTIF